MSEVKEEVQKTNSYFEYFVSSKKIDPQAVLALFLSAMSTMMALYFLMTAYYGTPAGIAHRLIFLLFVLLHVFFLFPTKRKNWNDKFNIYFFVDLFLALCTLGVGVYFLGDLHGWQARFFRPNLNDTIAGTITILLVLEATRRAVGAIMTVIALLFILHTSFANYFPGLLRAAPTRWARLVDVMVSDQGILSDPIQSMATFIILFLVFGALLEQTGAGRYFINMAYSVGGRLTAGPAKTSVIASALFGSISGSSVANVASTGVFTIPLMKSVGYSAEESAAIEAVGSTGGNYIPPIMGAVAFLMAQFLRVPYMTIVQHAWIPAFVYYFALLATVHFSGKRKNIAPPVEKDKLPSFWKALKESWHLFFSLLVLVMFLMQGYTATMAAFWGTVMLFALSFIRRDTWITPRKMIVGFEKVAKTALTVGMACATAGIIIGSMFSSGIGARLSWIVINAAGGDPFITLIYTAIISLILGCGMPSVGVYLILVTTVIPALIELGINPVAAHFFAFYFAVVSNFTPPVCVATFAAAAIAESSPMKSALKAFFVGISTYVIPFIFVYHTGLLMIGSAGDILIATFRALLAVFFLSAAVNGFLLKRVSLIERAIMITIPILIIIPESMPATIIGLTLAAVSVFLQNINIKSQFVLIRR